MLLICNYSILDKHTDTFRKKIYDRKKRGKTKLKKAQKSTKKEKRALKVPSALVVKTYLWYRTLARASLIVLDKHE
jgi:hypothetical protein